MRRSRVLWSEGERKYLKEAFAEKAEPHIISRELKRRFNTERTVAAINAQISGMQREKAKEKNAEEDSGEESLPSAAKEKAKGTKKNKLVIPSLEPVESLRKGTVVFLPGCGVVKSKGIEKTEVMGLSIETILLEEVYFDTGKIKTSQGRFPIPRSKIDQKGIRALHSVETLDKVLKYLKESSSLGIIPGNSSMKKEAYLKNLLISGDLKELSELLIRLYKPHGEINTGYTELKFKAQHRLTGEYAASANISYQEAKKKVEEALDIKSWQALDRNSRPMTSPAP